MKWKWFAGDSVILNKEQVEGHQDEDRRRQAVGLQSSNAVEGPLEKEQEEEEDEVQNCIGLVAVDDVVDNALVEVHDEMAMRRNTHSDTLMVLFLKCGVKKRRRTTISSLDCRIHLVEATIPLDMY